MPDTRTNTLPSRARIAFFGTPSFAVPILHALRKAGLSPQIVVTATDKPIGRKQIITPPPAKIWASEHDIEVLQPASLKDFSLPGHWDLFVVAAYGKIIPQRILDIPKHGTLNVHPSLLPKWRGPSPLQSSIIAGDSHTGVSIMLLDAEMDHGPILAEAPYTMDTRETYQSLHDTLASMGGAVLASLIPVWISGNCIPREQNHAEATYTKKFLTEDGFLNLETVPGEEIDRRVRALNPEPGTFAFFNTKKGERIRVKILETNCEHGKLEILKVQPEGKTSMTGDDFEKRFGATL